MHRDSSSTKALAQDVHTFLEQCRPVLPFYAEGREFPFGVALRNAYDHPAVGEQVCDGCVFGDAQRVVHRQDEDAGTDPDLVGPCGDRCCHDQRRGQEPIRRQVVLGHPARVEAEAVGLGDLIEAFRVVVGVRLVVRLNATCCRCRFEAAAIMTLVIATFGACPWVDQWAGR
jgi:hypothetical protein